MASPVSFRNLEVIENSENFHPTLEKIQKILKEIKLPITEGSLEEIRALEENYKLQLNDAFAELSKMDNPFAYENSYFLFGELLAKYGFLRREESSACLFLTLASFNSQIKACGLVYTLYFQIKGINSLSDLEMSLKENFIEGFDDVILNRDVSVMARMIEGRLSFERSELMLFTIQWLIKSLQNTQGYKENEGDNQDTNRKRIDQLKVLSENLVK